MTTPKLNLLKYSFVEGDFKILFLNSWCCGIQQNLKLQQIAVKRRDVAFLLRAASTLSLEREWDWIYGLTLPSSFLKKTSLSEWSPLALKPGCLSLSENAALLIFQVLFCLVQK